MTSIDVEVLKTVLVAEPGNLRGREIVKGTTDKVPAHLFDDLKREGYVLEAGSIVSLNDGSDVLRADGPTVQEHVDGAGQSAAHVKMTADLEKLTVAQLRDLAGAEKIELASDLNKAGIVEAIAAARAAAAKS